MSVAFRRDSDEEHLEPKFERPVPAGPNLVTARGVRLIEERIAAIEAELATALEGQPRDALQRDLRYWKSRQVTAELAPVSSANKVEFGTRVTFALNGKTRTLTLVGDDEADPSAGLISFNAPLSHAMLGAEAGEERPFGGAPDAIEILSITAAL